jgi:hypothetical protein
MHRSLFECPPGCARRSNFSDEENGRTKNSRRLRTRPSCIEGALIFVPGLEIAAVEKGIFSFTCLEGSHGSCCSGVRRIIFAELLAKLFISLELIPANRKAQISR